MKKFLSSIWFKCISVLLIIAVVSGGLLSILNNVLYVSDEERLKRAVKSVYGKDVSAQELVLDDSFSSTYGTIDKLYSFTDGGKDYLLFKATGNNGYKGGTVTLWVLTQESIEKVILADSNKQTLMSKLTGSFYSAYESISLTDILNGKVVTVFEENNSIKNVVSGATYSSTASNNAINVVLDYLRSANEN